MSTSLQQIGTQIAAVQAHKIPKVYQCINKVQADLAKTGISKNQKNTQQNYKFRGIDDLYNALGGVLASNGLCVLPRALTREVTERETKSGGTLFSVLLTVELDLVCAEDASVHTIRMFGEAMDSGDKATNKASTAAYKYACLQAFCIPIDGEEQDSDATTHSNLKPIIRPAIGRVLNSEELSILKFKIDQAGDDESNICTLMKIDCLDNFPADKWQAAIRSLDKKIANKQKSASLPINEAIKEATKNQTVTKIDPEVAAYFE
jgi:hypothetical protein